MSGDEDPVRHSDVGRPPVHSRQPRATPRSEAREHPHHGPRGRQDGRLRLLPEGGGGHGTGEPHPALPPDRDIRLPRPGTPEGTGSLKQSRHLRSRSDFMADVSAGKSLWKREPARGDFQCGRLRTSPSPPSDRL